MSETKNILFKFGNVPVLFRYDDSSVGVKVDDIKKLSDLSTDEEWIPLRDLVYTLLTKDPNSKFTQWLWHDIMPQFYKVNVFDEQPVYVGVRYIVLYKLRSARNILIESEEQVTLAKKLLPDTYAHSWKFECRESAMKMERTIRNEIPDFTNIGINELIERMSQIITKHTTTDK